MAPIPPTGPGGMSAAGYSQWLKNAQRLMQDKLAREKFLKQVMQQAMNETGKQVTKNGGKSGAARAMQTALQRSRFLFGSAAEGSSAARSGTSAFNMAARIGARGTAGAASTEAVVAVAAVVVLIAVAWCFYQEMQKAQEEPDPVVRQRKVTLTAQQRDAAYRAWMDEVNRRRRTPRVAR